LIDTLLAFIFHALHGAFVNIWVANITSSLVVITDTHMSTGAVAEVVEKASNTPYL
jgi:hypothetical protein